MNELARNRCMSANKGELQLKNRRRRQLVSRMIGASGSLLSMFGGGLLPANFTCDGEPKRRRSWSRANELSLKTRAWSQIFKLCPSLPYLHPTDFASGGGPQFCRVLVVFDWLGYLWAVGGFNILRPEGMQETDHSYYLFCFYVIFDGYFLVSVHFLLPHATSTRNTLVTSTTSAFTAATQPPQSLSYQVNLPPLTLGFPFSSRINPLFLRGVIC